MQVEDVRLGRAEHIGDRGERTGLVLDDDLQSGGAALGLAVPAQIDPVVVLARLQRAAVDGVDLDRLAGAADADDAVARHRVAAFAQIIGNARRQATDRDRGMLAGMGFFQFLAAGGAGDQRLHHFGIEQAMGRDRHHQRGTVVQLEALERGIERLVAQFARQFGREAADDFLIEFFAQRHFLAALLLADEAANGGARLAGDGEAEPAGLGFLAG